MKRFQFGLERLCRVRRIQEEQERERWLEAELVRRDAEAEEQALRAAQHATKEDLRTRQGAEALGILEVLQGQEALERANIALRDARERTLTAAYQADRMRGPWEERRKEVRGLERLEERAKAVWRREELRNETKEMDEVAHRRSQPTDRSPTGRTLRPIRENSPSQGDQDVCSIPGPQGGPGSGRSKTGQPVSDGPEGPDRT